jgi:hypothetical protein
MGGRGAADRAAVTQGRHHIDRQQQSMKGKGSEGQDGVDGLTYETPIAC